MNKKQILGFSFYGFSIMISICIIGIIIGSIWDYDINSKIYNKTDIGAFFATYGSYLSYCLYPAEGMCFFKAFKNQNYNLIAWVLLIFAYFLAVYYSNNYNGSKVSELFKYDYNNPNYFKSILSYLFWIVLYAWVPILFYFILDDTNPKALICVGVIIILAGVVSDCVNFWLKQVASRPRYKYLITLEEPLSEFKNWWEMTPYKAGSNDNFKSWPSGNMTIATMLMSLPLLLNVIKYKKIYINIIAYVFALAYVLLYGYNRMHMGNHFLTDVCFGTLITYLIYVCTDISFSTKLMRLLFISLLLIDIINLFWAFDDV